MTPEYLLTVKAVAAKVSFSVAQVRKMVRQGRFPQPLTVGGSTRWRGADVDSWIAEVASQPRTSRKFTADQVSA